MDDLAPTTPSPQAGRALVLAAPGSHGLLSTQLAEIGLDAEFVDDPYSLLLELLQRPLVYRAAVLSLQALYKQELTLIRTLRSRLPHLDAILVHTDGRSAALAEGMRLCATALLAEDGLHRLVELADAEAAPSDPTPASPPAALPIAKPLALGLPPLSLSTEPEVKPAASLSIQPIANEPADPEPDLRDTAMDPDPILTADELRALLQDATDRA